jgi:hypothetical protein
MCFRLLEVDNQQPLARRDECAALDPVREAEDETCSTQVYG